MGKLAVKRYMSLMMLILQFVVSIFTYVGLFGGDSSPIGNVAAAMCVYILPVLILANILMLLYWLILRNWFILPIPVITVLCCIPYLGTIYQPGLLRSEVSADNGLKVASYNVAMFGRSATGFIAQDVLAEMRRENVDVFCIQEYTNVSGDKKVTDIYKDYFPYVAIGRDDMAIFSRYPITGTKSILFENTNNSAMWANINVNGKQVRIYNAHLETTGFNRTLHQAAKMMNKGVKVEENAIINAIYGNYTLGMIIRAGQANTVAMDMRNSNLPCIVCGDFNDVPYSYVYNVMMGDRMVDGFKECGKGFMGTYRGAKPVRIDYIRHDKSMTGFTYYTKDMSYSDHIPVFMSIGL